MLHRIAIAQALPEAVDNSHGDKEQIMQLAQQMPSEDVQLFYQTALLGRRDLPLAPDPRAGFEMVLLRMLAFKPQGVIDVPTQALPQAQASSQPVVRAVPPPVQQAAPQAVSQPAANPAPINSQPVAQPIVETSVVETSIVAVPAPQVVAAESAQKTENIAPESLPFDAPYDNASYDNISENIPENISDNMGEDYDEYAPAPAYLDASGPATEAQVVKSEEYSTPKKPEAAVPHTVVDAVKIVNEESVSDIIAEAVTASPQQKVPYEHATPKDWPAIYVGLGVSGILQSTVANCQWVGRQGNEFHFIVDENNNTLYDPSHQQRLADLLSDYFVERIHVKIETGKVNVETPAMIAIRHKQEKQAGAVVAIKTDPIVLQLIEQFDAILREDTIEPV